MPSTAYTLHPDTAADFLDHVGHSGIADAVRGLKKDLPDGHDLDIGLEVTVYHDHTPSYYLRAEEIPEHSDRYGTGSRIRDHGTVTADATQYLTTVADIELPEALEVDSDG